MLVSKLFVLMILGLGFGFESGGLGLETKHLAREVVQKSTFAQIGDTTIQRSIFLQFRAARCCAECYLAGLKNIARYVIFTISGSSMLWNALWKVLKAQCLI